MNSESKYDKMIGAIKNVGGQEYVEKFNIISSRGLALALLRGADLGEDANRMVDIAYSIYPNNVYAWEDFRHELSKFKDRK